MSKRCARSAWPSRPVHKTTQTDKATTQYGATQEERQVAAATRHGRSTERQTDGDGSLYRERERECVGETINRRSRQEMVFHFCLALLCHSGCHEDLQHTHEWEQRVCTCRGAVKDREWEKQPCAEESVERRLDRRST